MTIYSTKITDIDLHKTVKYCRETQKYKCMSILQRKYNKTVMNYNNDHKNQSINK